MKLEQSFEVAAPLDRVWRTLIDVEHVAPCLPGAAVTGRNDDGSYNGTFTVKIGPTTASYTGRLQMESVDEASHTATMQAQGTDKRGQGGAKATIHSRLAPADGTGTRVEVVTDYHITGRLARFGRGGMIEDISERLLREFAKRLQSSLAAQQDTIVSSGAPAPAAEAVPAAEPAAAVGAAASAGEGDGAPARDETMFAPAPTGSTADVPPGPSEEPVTVGEGPPPPPEAPAVPAGDITPPAPGAPAAGAEPGAEPPPPPPPPSPGPPPVVTPPPAPSAVPPPPPGAASEPPLPQPSEPMQGLSLVGGVVWGRVRRNPAPVAAAGVAVMLLMARRRRKRRA
jgi:carbon monoxide dehydrogenase subunit G